MNLWASLRLNFLPSILTTVILSSINIKAQPEQWENYDPYWWNINSIEQDSNDLWIGKSKGGAVKFNRSSYEMEYYKRYYTGLTSNTILKIEVDTFGNKWFGLGASGNTEKAGIAKYDGVNWQIFNSSNSILPDQNYNNIAADINGNLWVGTFGSGLLKYDGLVWTKYDSLNSGIPTNRPGYIQTDSEGNVWFLMTENYGSINKNRLVKYDGIGWKIIQPDTNGLPWFGYQLVEIDSDDNVWVSAYARILKFDRTGFHLYNADSAGIFIGVIRCMEVDSDGNCFIGSEYNGLLKRDKNGNWTEYRVSVYDNLNVVFDIHIDENNVIWLSTYDGLKKFDELEFTDYKVSNAPLLDVVVSDVIKDDQENLFFGTSGLVKYDGTNWTKFVTGDSTFPYYGVSCLAVDSKNTIWAGAEGLIKLEDTIITKYTPANSNFPDTYVRDLVVDHNDIVWAATNYGLARIENDSITVFNESNSPLIGNYIITIEVDRYNNKWIGGWECGLVKFDDYSWTSYTNSNSQLLIDEIFDIAIDKNNNLWLAMGAVQKVQLGSDWPIYFPSNILQIDDEVTKIAADSVGNIWASANQNGIIKIDPWNNWTILNNQNAGLIGVDQIVNSIYIDENGYKYFSTNDGGVSVYKGDLVLGIQNNPNGAVVSDFKIFQNYPNPFNPTTTIKYEVPQISNVKIEVFDVLGRIVKVLVDEQKTTGFYEIKFDASSFASGIYYYRIKANEFVQTKKMILIK